MRITDSGESNLGGLLKNPALAQKIWQRTSDAAAVISNQQQSIAAKAPSWVKPIVLNGRPRTDTFSVSVSAQMSQEELMTAVVGRADYSKYDYTKEDAVFFKNRAETSALRMDEAFRKEVSSDFRAHFGIARHNADEIRQEIDYMASLYAARRERILSGAGGAEQTAQLTELDAWMDTSRRNLARDFADAVGGIFEENGVEGEKERLYQSVVAELDSRAAQYAGFAKANNDYADIDGPDEEWLRQNSEYMAAELRRAIAGTHTAPLTGAADSAGYTVDELEKMYVFANEMASYSKRVPGSDKAVNTGNETEESLGLKLAELTLKGKVFNAYAGVSEKVKNTVNQAVEGFISNSIEKEQAFNELWMSRQITAIRKNVTDAREKGRPTFSDDELAAKIAAIQRGFAQMDADAVNAVISKVTETYEKTGKIGKTLTEGAIFAHNTVAEKLRSGSSEGINRYDNNLPYWNNFFVGQDKASHQDAYGPKESGFDAIVSSYNAFVEQITSDRNAFFAGRKLSANA